MPFAKSCARAVHTPLVLSCGSDPGQYHSIKAIELTNGTRHPIQISRRCTCDKEFTRDAPGRIRTSDQQLRRLLLYPPELRARDCAATTSGAVLHRASKQCHKQSQNLMLSYPSHATAVTLQRQRVVGVAQTGIATAPADFESATAESYSTNKAEADPSCD